MANMFAKTALALGLLAAAAPAIARGWDDFTPREPSSKQPGRWEWAWDGSDGLGVSTGSDPRCGR